MIARPRRHPRARASLLALLTGATLLACLNDFDKFEETGVVEPADASNDRADTGPSDAGRDASDGASAVDAAPCRETPATCVSQRETCREACDATRQTCEDACTGGNQAQCRSKCRTDQDDCRNKCNDTCRTCAGSCPTSSCR